MPLFKVPTTGCFSRVMEYSRNVNVIPAVMTIKEVKKEIKDYVYDHYKYYGFYPYDVEVGNVVYTYEQYMDILSMTV